MEKFSYETNGYNRNEVNQFISDVIRETEGIISKVRAQSSNSFFNSCGHKWY